MQSYVKHYVTKKSDLEPGWHVVDAAGKTLGRFASEIAVLLMGKHKTQYVPNLNTGDFVIVLNAKEISVTGKKLEQKIYYR
jgi:large subunit ribosomal protein L13